MCALFMEFDDSLNRTPDLPRSVLPAHVTAQRCAFGTEVTHSALHPTSPYFALKPSHLRRTEDVFPLAGSTRDSGSTLGLGTAYGTVPTVDLMLT